LIAPHSFSKEIMAIAAFFSAHSDPAEGQQGQHTVPGRPTVTNTGGTVCTTVMFQELPPPPGSRLVHIYNMDMAVWRSKCDTPH
jgi:hypothetical protein